ncbi:hypothetical protein D3C79_981340 [compost metagenome]
MLYQSVDLGPIEQVTGLVILEVFNLGCLPVGTRPVSGLQLVVEVIAITVASGKTPAAMGQIMEAADDLFEVCCVIAGSVGHTSALGLRQRLTDEVVAGVIAIGLLQQRRYFN